MRSPPGVIEARIIGSAAPPHNAAAGRPGHPARLPANMAHHLPAARTRHAPVQLPDHHPAGSPRRRRGGQPPADAARRPDPQARRRPLHLAAAGPARAAQGRAHRARGDGPRRRAGGADAGGAAGRAVAGIRALGAVRPGAAAPQGPPRARLLLRPDARGGHHRPGAARDQELPAAAGQFLPDPDQVPRRDPAALRRDARARVPDEGRLLLPRRRGLAASRPTRRCTTPTRASSRAAASSSAPVQADTGSIGGSASHEFQVLADSGEDAIAFSDGDDYAANVETGARRWRRPARAPRRDRRRCARSTRPARTPSTSWSAVPRRSSATQMPEDPAGRRRPTAAWWRWCCAATTSSTRSRPRSCPASPRRCAWPARRAGPRGHRLRARLPRPGGPAAAR